MRPPRLCVFAPLREPLVLFLSIVGVTSVSASDRPNFVFIQGEGLGWASTSVQLDPNEPESKSDSFSTPNLERLAAEGIRFSNYYAPAETAVMNVSRKGAKTQRNQFRISHPLRLRAFA